MQYIKLLNKLLYKILLQDSIEFNGTIWELKEQTRFRKDRRFELKWIDEKNLKFISIFSLGTLLVNGLPVEGIKGYGKLTDLGNGKTRIDLTTKIRVELYFFFAVFLIIFLIAYFTGERWPIWIYSLLPISLIWFWFVYRVQEKELFRRFKNYIMKDLRANHTKMDN